MNRTQRILVALLLFQIVLSAVLLRPRKMDGGGGEPLLAGLTADDVIGLKIDGGESSSVELNRVDGVWSLPAVDDYPAKDTMLKGALDKLVKLDTKRLITRTASSHKRLQVSADEYVRRIEVTTSAGRTYALFLGSSPSYGATHVRLDGKDETYLAGDLSPWELGTTTTSWVDTAFVSVPEEEIASVVISNANGVVTIDHDTAGKWALADLAVGESQNDEAISSAVTRASSMTLQAPLGKTQKLEYGLDNALAIVKIQLKDGEPLTLTVGAQDAGDRTYVVKSSSSPYFVRVAEYSVKPLVENARSAYLAVPATPTLSP